MSIPYMPLYTSDYIGDTHHLTTLEHGAYLLILMTMWNAGGSLPDDMERIRKIAKLSKANWLKVWPNIREFFTIDEGRIFQKRLRQTHDVVTQKRKALSENGKKGGRPKSLKNNDEIKAKAIEKLKQPEPEPELDISLMSSSNEESIRDADAAKISSDKDFIWSQGVDLLVRNGSKLPAAKSLIGRFVKDAGGGPAGEKRVADAVMVAIKAGSGDPGPYIAAILKKPAPQPANLPSDGIPRTRIEASEDGKTLRLVSIEDGRIIKELQAA